jgi:hypothetical protein
LCCTIPLGGWLSNVLLVYGLILGHDVIRDVHVVRTKVTIHIAVLDKIKLVENLAVTLEVIRNQAELVVIHSLAALVAAHILVT